MGLPLIWWIGMITSLVLAAILVWRIHRAAQRRSAERMIADWNAMFPNRCLVCSFHRHAMLHAATNDSEPHPHLCPEGRSQPIPELPEARAHRRARLEA